MNEHRSSLAREWLWIGSLTLVGAVLRFWAFGRVTLDHFDEGIYATSGLWIAADRGLLGLDPMVIPYAPGGFPILIGVSYLAFGVSDHAAILAATVCGVATTPVVGWLGRRVFGPGAGAASAVFAALAMAHVAFSRKALTDVPFLLAWLVAIGQGCRFLERPGLGRALALGLTVGAAQNLKYNGWLAGLIVIVAAACGTIRGSDQRRAAAMLRTYGWGLVAALTAGLTVTPWYRFVDSHGGYAALLRHQRGYLGGVSSWSTHWSTQMGEAFALSGSRRWGALTWSLAWLVSGLAASNRWPAAVGNQLGTIGSLSVLVLGASLFALQPNNAWWIGLAWTPWLLRTYPPAQRVVGAWWLVMSILTPFYHPYARLWLPLHGAGWILLGGGLVRSWRPCPVAGEVSGAASPWARRLQRGVLVLCAVLSSIQVVRTSPVAMPWRWVLQPTRTATLPRFVLESLGDRATEAPRIVRVLGRRPLAFYLILLWRGSVDLEPGLAPLLQPGEPDHWAMIDGALLENEGGREAALHRLVQYWRLERSARAEVDPVTLLDIHPGAAFEDQPRRDFELWLLSPRIPPGAPDSRGPGQPSTKGRHAP